MQLTVTSALLTLSCRSRLEFPTYRDLGLVDALMQAEVAEQESGEVDGVVPVSADDDLAEHRHAVAPELRVQEDCEEDEIAPHVYQVQHLHAQVHHAQVLA